MDINTVYGLITLVLLILFIGIVFWAYSGRRKADFDEAAQLALTENRDRRPGHREDKGHE
jgi:cytochrome c oxidase cbb3-type subunit IV